jgi:hypothetical protein
MKIKMSKSRRLVRTITLLRAEKSKDLYRHAPGGRERRRTRPIPSLPKLTFLDNHDQRLD